MLQYVRSNNGSPPLARRGPLAQRGRADARRLTSARAERTDERAVGDGNGTAHLRSRGEDSQCRCQVGAVTPRDWVMPLWQPGWG